MQQPGRGATPTCKPNILTGEKQQRTRGKQRRGTTGYNIYSAQSKKKRIKYNKSRINNQVRIKYIKYTQVHTHNQVFGNNKVSFNVQVAPSTGRRIDYTYTTGHKTVTCISHKGRRDKTC